jgi:hypothetical protein
LSAKFRISGSPIVAAEAEVAAASCRSAAEWRCAGVIVIVVAAASGQRRGARHGHGCAAGGLEEFTSSFATLRACFKRFDHY